jgi:hypothetical protein
MKWPPLCGSALLSQNDFKTGETIQPQEASSVKHPISVLGIDIAKRVFHVVGMGLDHGVGHPASFSLSHCSSRWTEGCRRKIDCPQYSGKHRAGLLTEKALRCRRPVRPGEEKVVNGSEALPLTRQSESSQLMATQG